MQVGATTTGQQSDAACTAFRVRIRSTCLQRSLLLVRWVQNPQPYPLLLPHSCLAAVMAACAQQADYGKQRLWGAIGWGICSALAGAAISHTGIWAAFAGHAVLAVVAAVPTARLPFGPLHAKLDRQAGRHDNSESGSSGGAADGGAASESAEGGKSAVARFDSATEAQALLSHRKLSASAKPEAAACRGGGSGGSSEAEQRDAAGQLPRASQPTVRFWAGVAQLLSNPEASIFFVQALTMGFGVGALGLDYTGALHCIVVARVPDGEGYGNCSYPNSSCPAACHMLCSHALADLHQQCTLRYVHAGNIESYLFLFLDQLGAGQSSTAAMG